ncbi:MAG TPA: hypothetical protein VFL59_11985 [Candidatus Nanopelagicales bacterium]|nr:hypothetical protein [Candidatus Nanopelagicales bacterium]
MTTAASRPAGRRLAVATAVVVAVLVAVVVALLPRAAPFGNAARSVVGPGVAAPVPAGETGEARLAAVTSVLDARATAVRKDDAKGFARTQTRTARAPAFARLAVLPFVRWAYTPGPPTTSSSQVVVVPVTLTTRLAGETADATWTEAVTLARSGATWLVTSEVSVGGRTALWDLGTLRVARGARSLVIGIDTPTTTLRRYAATADRVVPQVAAVWGSDWSRFAVVIVPRTVGQLARALGRSPGSLDGYAAVTTSEGALAGHHVTERVWINTPAMADLSSLGREVVLRHELTHVATWAPEHPGAPLWLVEGVAEWMGYRGSGIPLQVATGDLLDEVRRGRTPAALPADSAFSGDAVDIAYESSHLACAVVVARFGVPALVSLYRKVVLEGEELSTAYQQVTGEPLTGLRASWRAKARALAS